MRIKGPELLAPAGGLPQLRAAVRCGADAVYFGMRNFNARRNADNFGGEDLRDVVRYCHDSGVKVHITINTLVKDAELETARKAADTAAECGADAVIVQDMAVAAHIREYWPDLRLHASTQTAVHNLAGVRALAALGFSRIVLARELSFAEISEIAQNTNAEVEVFVHGAHCMSVSGNCYMSSMFGGRSGNRGLCAQPCRLAWRLDGRDAEKGEARALSLRDMCAVPHIENLSRAGVASLKIEGRMKRPEYVAAAVTACRAALDGKEPDLDTLRAVFSRSGFTDGYMTGRRGPDMFGYRTKEDVTAASGVLEDIAKLYDKEDRRIATDMYLSVKASEPVRLTVRAEGFSAEAAGSFPQTAVSRETDAEQAEKSLAKTGGTHYSLGRLVCGIERGLFVPVSELNALRRQALDALDEARHSRFERAGKAEKNVPEGTLAEYEAPERPQLRLRFEKAAQVFSASGPDGGQAVVVLPAEEIASCPELAAGRPGTLWAELPCMVYGLAGERALRETLRALPESVRDVVCGNIGSAALALEEGFAVHGGFELNVANSRAAEEYRRFGLSDVTLSPELSFSDIRAMRGTAARGALLYGHIPLMKMRACPARGERGCGGCSGLNSMTDRTGRSFALICRRREYAELLNCVPLYLADRAVPDMDFQELYFTTESPGRCREVFEAFRAGRAADFPKTAGMYFRELL